MNFKIFVQFDEDLDRFLNKKEFYEFLTYLNPILNDKDKESIFKLKNEKGISFPKHIFESPFKLADRKGNAKLIFNNTIEEFQFQFDITEDYAFVCALTK